MPEIKPPVIYETNVGKYKKVVISNNWFSAGITPELGGKILSFSYKGFEMYFCLNNLDYLPKDIEKKEDIKEFRKGLRYLPPGGYKSWLSPQSKWGWPPYIDIEAGVYEHIINSNEDNIEMILRSVICRESEIQIERRVTIGTDNECIVNEKITNCGSEAKEYGIWGVTQLKRAGVAIFPVGKEKNIINLGTKDYEEYIEFVQIEDLYYAVVKCCDKKDFKIGTNYSEGWILSLFFSDKIYGYLKRFPQHGSDAKYGHDCAVEIYNSPVFEYFEVETHAPVKELEAGKSAESFEKWSVYEWEKETGYSDIIKIIKWK